MMIEALNIKMQEEAPHITDMDIQALIDNELDPERHRLVLDAIENSPDLRKRFTLYVHQKKLLRLWWKDN